jgi:TRAP-type C4-dicarboxylate transport system permease small subunit
MEFPTLMKDRYSFISYYALWIGFGLWCLMLLSTLYRLYCDSVLLVEESRVPGENHRPVTSY